MSLGLHAKKNAFPSQDSRIVTLQNLSSDLALAVGYGERSAFLLLSITTESRLLGVTSQLAICRQDNGKRNLDSC